MAMTHMRGSIEPFLNSLSERGHPSNTLRAYRSDVRMFLTWMEKQPPESLELRSNALSSLMAQYVTNHRDTWAPTTTQRKLTSLRAFARFLGVSVLEDYNAPTPARARPHPLPEGMDGVIKLIDQADNNQQRALVALCGLVGLRVHEALNVTTQDVDLESQMLYVRGKGAKHREVPISTAAWAHIAPAYADALVRATHDGTETAPLVPYGDRRARAIITTLGQRAGLTRAISSHDLRATFATAAYGKTKNLRAVQDLLGHSTSKTTEVYTGITTEAMREASELIEESG